MRYMTADELVREQERMRPWSVVGVDLGQSNDYTAVTVLRAMPQREDKTTFQCGHIERLKLGTPYPRIVESVLRLTERPELEDRWYLVIDATGVGKAVTDMFREALGPQNKRLAGVTITAGNQVTGGGLNFGVPKQDLVTTLLVLLESGRLVFADLPEMTQLLSEIPDFRVKITTSGNAIWGTWREGAHDDLILSLAIAAWYANRVDKRVSRFGHSFKPWTGGVA